MRRIFGVVEYCALHERPGGHWSYWAGSGYGVAFERCARCGETETVEEFPPGRPGEDKSTWQKLSTECPGTGHPIYAEATNEAIAANRIEVS